MAARGSDLARETVELDIEAAASKLSIDEPISCTREEAAWTGGVPNDVSRCLPSPKFMLVDDYHICDAPQLGPEYVRFATKEVIELGDRVEYDCDEEDVIWLRLANERRRQSNLPPVSVEDMEYLVDRLEKESFLLQCHRSLQDDRANDSEVLCCICNDGECQNANAIIFCDSCNIPVHQGCYGVPYIPEGTWLCQRCSHGAPSNTRCCLCPSSVGAFKQTSEGRWAHVICALWVPEVSFGNAVFLEPIEEIEAIPQARWKLTCSICRQKGVGACIQCQKPSCCAAFHVTCAQQANLYMKMETVTEASPSGRGGVQKVVMCASHGPSSTRRGPHPSWGKSPPKFNPDLPESLIHDIAAGVAIPRKHAFMKQLLAYWILKRQSRNWAPLVRRLQTLPLDAALVSPGGSRSIQSDAVRSSDSEDDRSVSSESVVCFDVVDGSDDEVTLPTDPAKQLDKIPSTVSNLPLIAELVKPLPNGTCPKQVIKNDAANQPKRPRVEEQESRPPRSRSSETRKRPPTNLDELPKSKVEPPPGLLQQVPISQIPATWIPQVVSGTTSLVSMPSFPFGPSVIPISGPPPLILRQTIPLPLQPLRLQAPMHKKPLAQRENQPISAKSVSPNVAERAKRKIIPKKVWEPDSGPQSKQQTSKAPNAQPASKPSVGAPNAVRNVAIRPSLVNGGQVGQQQLITAITSVAQTPLLSSVPIPTFIRPFVPSPIINVCAAPKSFLQYRSCDPTKVPSDDEAESGKKEQDQKVADVPRKLADEQGPGMTDSDSSESSSTSSSSSSDEESSSDSSDSEEDSPKKDVQKLSNSKPGRGRPRKKGNDSLAKSTSSHSSGGGPAKFEPLDLVWAKCRGYPWYPALVIDPQMPRKGFCHNGVPIPVPPEEVLALRHKYPEKRYLILFFDNRRTWQWLTRDKMDPLGVNSAFDRSKLLESRKPAERKAVKKAYERAVIHYAKVSRMKEIVGGEGIDLERL